MLNNVIRSETDPSLIFIVAFNKVFGEHVIVDLTFDEARELVHKLQDIIADE